MTEQDRVAFVRLQEHVLFLDRVIITLLKERDMSNLTDLQAAEASAVTTIGALVTLLTDKEAKLAAAETQVTALQSQIDAGASDDAALTAVTLIVRLVAVPGQTLVETLLPVLKSVGFDITTVLDVNVNPLESVVDPSALAVCVDVVDEAARSVCISDDMYRVSVVVVLSDVTEASVVSL